MGIWTKIFGKPQCDSISLWYDFRCQRDADHPGAHQYNDRYYKNAFLWFSCLECGTPTVKFIRICDGCINLAELSKPHD